MIFNFKWKILLQSIVICLVSSGIWTSCLAQGTIYVSGMTIGKTTWSADTVKVTGGVTVDSLYIDPGTVVEFQGNYNLKVNYCLEANGTAGDTILFTINDTAGFSNLGTSSGGWGGIYMQLLRQNKGVFTFCKFQYAKNSHGVIWNDRESSPESKIEISNCLIFNNNSNGLYANEGRMSIYRTLINKNKGIGINGGFFSCVEIKECIIKNNTSDGIRSSSSSGTKLSVDNSVIESNKGHGIYTREANGGVFIKGNVIQNNQSGGVYLTSQVEESHGIIGNNIIRSNIGSGISLGEIYALDFIVINNLIYNNSGEGIFLNQNSSPLINNTILNNSDGVIIPSKHDAGLHIFNCIIRNNNSSGENQIRSSSVEYPGIQGEIINSNIEDFTASDLDGEFIGNIDIDPQFTDVLHHDYHLSDFSPCINAGTADTSGLNLSAKDLEGNPRIFDGRIDMGAFEYPKDNFHLLIQPVNQTVCEGERVSIETDAIGGVIGYKWQKNGADIPSANRRILTIDPVSLNDSGFYNCLIIADDKTVSTDTIIISIPNPDPPVSHDITICEGQPVPDLNASGDHITWYSDAELTNPVYSGSNFKTGHSNPGLYGYYVTQTVSGCESTAEAVKLTINTLPEISLGKDSTILTNQNFILGPYINSYSYLWNNDSENPYLEISGNDLGPGRHAIWVVVKDANACENSDTMIVHVVQLTNLNQTQNNHLLRIFPNPTDGLLNIEVSDFNDEDIIVKLFNQLSEEIYSDHICVENEVGPIQLNLTSVPAGIYYVQIITNNTQYMGKVVLQ